MSAAAAAVERRCPSCATLCDDPAWLSCHECGAALTSRPVRACVAPPRGPNADKLVELGRIAGLRSRDVADGVLVLVEDLARKTAELARLEHALQLVRAELREEGATLDSLTTALGFVVQPAEDRLVQSDRFARARSTDVLEEARLLVDVKGRAERLARIVAGELGDMPSHRALSRGAARELLDLLGEP